MALVRALLLGVDARGGKIKPGTVFEHAGPLASWMELVEGQAPSPAPSKAAPEASAEPQQSEAAADPVAEAKPRKPRGKGAE